MHAEFPAAGTRGQARRGQKVCDKLWETGKRSQREEVAAGVLCRPAMDTSFLMSFLKSFPGHTVVASSLVVP